jgi:hypothetical protein
LRDDLRVHIVTALRRERSALHVAAAKNLSTIDIPATGC